MSRFGLSSIYLLTCRKLLHFRQRGKGPQNAKKRGLRPEKSGGSPACGGSLRILLWTSTVKLFPGFSVPKPQTRMNTKKRYPLPVKLLSKRRLAPSWIAVYRPKFRLQNRSCSKVLKFALIKQNTIYNLLLVFRCKA